MEQQSPVCSKKIKQKHSSKKSIDATASKAKNIGKQINNAKEIISKVIANEKIGKCVFNNALKIKKGAIKNNYMKKGLIVKKKHLKRKKLELLRCKIQDKKNVRMKTQPILMSLNADVECQQELHNASNYGNNCQKTGDICNNPYEHVINLFKWLIFPLDTRDFFKIYFEKSPIHIRRDTTTYYSHLASTPILDKILRNEYVQFGKNIDITSYRNGVKEVHTPQGRAVPSVVWDFYKNDCSVRLLNPQTFISNIFNLNACFQELFGCFVGANLYLTPPNSQGFAPHYDDIEAFVLQIEGKKRWRLYKPPEKDHLPRFSSKNFDQSELGKPIMDVTVTAGSLLYFPRGTIHQAETEDAHSLHITLSVYQKNSWCDFLEKLLTLSLKQATESEYHFRTGLPMNYLNYCGIAHSDDPSKKFAREGFCKKIKLLLNRLMNYLDIDNAADLMAKEHIHDFLPPFLSNKESESSVAQDGEIVMKKGIVTGCEQINCNTSIRLLKLHCMRLVKEVDEDNQVIYKIYYSTENSKEYHEYEPMYLEVEEEYTPAIKQIIRAYPDYIRVGDLLIDSYDAKIQVVTDLWEKGIVITKIPRRNRISKNKKITIM